MSDPRIDPGRQWEKDVWYRYRFGARADEPTPGMIRRFLRRPLRVMLMLSLSTVVVLFGAYAVFGYGDPALSADHEAVTGTLEVDGTICCSVYQEIGGEEYVFMLVLDDPGFFGTLSHDVSLRVVSLGQDGAPHEIASLDAPIESTLPNTMAVVGETLYTSIGRGQGHENGVWIVDVATPEAPEEIGLAEVETARFDYVFAIQEGETLIAFSAEEIVFFDVSDAANPEAISTFQRPAPGIRQVMTEDSRLYSHTAHASQVTILEIADLRAVSPLGRHLNQHGLGRTLGQATRIASAEERLDRTSPARRYIDFTVKGDYLYVAASDLGLEVVDVSDPSSTETFERIDVGGRAVRVVIVDDRLHVLVANEHSRDRVSYEVHTFDLSDPEEPRLIEIIDDIIAVPGRQHMSDGGCYLFLAMNDTLLILDTRN